jgi:hypothetical protein
MFFSSGHQTQAGGDMFLTKIPSPHKSMHSTPSILSPVHINVSTKIGYFLGIAIFVVKKKVFDIFMRGCFHLIRCDHTFSNKLHNQITCKILFLINVIIKSYAIIRSTKSNHSSSKQSFFFIYQIMYDQDWLKQFLFTIVM